MNKSIRLAGAIFLSAIIFSCENIPNGASVVKGFDSQKYLGKWYEIARLDFVFEKDLVNTTAEYSLEENGNIKVKNRGYNWKTKQWKEAIGKARFQNSKDTGALEVSFFGPFYSAYNIVALDPEYKYALIMGKNVKYMWILSREKVIPDKTREEYLKIAKNTGFHIDDLIWVDHKEK